MFEKALLRNASSGWQIQNISRKDQSQSISQIKLLVLRYEWRSPASRSGGKLALEELEQAGGTVSLFCVDMGKDRALSMLEQASVFLFPEDALFIQGAIVSDLGDWQTDLLLKFEEEDFRDVL
eukprot:scaffold82090_cov31-Prasinocladus_malaysianus.AAC.3